MVESRKIFTLALRFVRSYVDTCSMPPSLSRFVKPMSIAAMVAALGISGMAVLPGGAEPSLSAVATTVPGPTTTTEALPEPTPPTSLAPLVTTDVKSDTVAEPDPWVVTVATARSTVTVPAMFDAPAGERVQFDDPVSNPTYFGTELALLVLDRQEEWLQVQLPVRPNGTTAWVHQQQFTLSTHSFHAEVQLTKHRLRVWDGEDLLVDTSAVVGTNATPTPLGRFYVNDLVPAENPAGSYGPWILSLSAHSEVLDTFIDGRPVIAIHGTNRTDLLGTDSSNGCIRIPNDLVSLLAETVPLGTPVDILS